MADLTTETAIFSGDTSVVDSSAKHILGTRAFDVDGNEYIYLLGVASTAAGSWVSFDEAHVTTLLTTNAVGRVGVAMAAIVASSYGWYQIYGKNTVALGVDGADAADEPVYTTATAGSIDDHTGGDTGGEMVIGAFIRVAESSNVCTVELNYPVVKNAAID